MVFLVVQRGGVSVNAYFPAGEWFDIFNYTELAVSGTGKNVTLDAQSDTINVTRARREHFDHATRSSDNAGCEGD